MDGDWSFCQPLSPFTMLLMYDPAYAVRDIFSVMLIYIIRFFFYCLAECFIVSVSGITFRNNFLQQTNIYVGGPGEDWHCNTCPSPGVEYALVYYNFSKLIDRYNY